MTVLWRGYHSSELLELIPQALQGKTLLLLLSPTLKDFSFLKLFDDIEFKGDWGDIDLPSLREKYPFQQGLGQEKLKDVIFGILTSGTQSGAPRLIFYTKENVLSSLESIRSLYQTERIKKIFCFPQPTHTFGFVLGYLQSFIYNIPLVPLSGHYSKNTLATWFEVVDQGTLTLGTPAHFVDLLSYSQEKNRSAPPSYSAILGGAPVTKKLWSQVQKKLNIESPSIGYGATEASPGVLHLGPMEKPIDDGDIGTPLKGVRVELVADGLEFSGENVCKAIFDGIQVQSPQKIKLKDLVIEREGHFFFQGRSDLVVNRGGLKISLEKIENMILSEFNLKSLAIDVFDPRLGSEIYLLLQSENPADSERAQKFLLEQGIKLLQENIILEKIPLNANLKFDRKTAKKRVLAKKGVSFPYSVQYLKDFLPHRAPIIWIDEISEVKEKYGKGTVYFNPQKSYATDLKLRKSSCIEFVAQCYGYSVILHDILGIKVAPIGQTTLLLEVKNVQFSGDFDQLDLKEGDPLVVEVRSSHDFGQLKILKGQVTYLNNLLAELELRAFVN